MGWLDGFPFKSREEQQRREKEFEKRVLPFGEEGKAAALAVLQQVVTSRKVDDMERLWTYFTLKDLYLLNDGGDEGVKAALKKVKGRVRMSEEDRIATLALIQLEENIPDLSAYPTPEAVLRQAEVLKVTMD